MLALRTSSSPVTTDEAAAAAHGLYGLVAGATPLPGERDSNFRLDTAAGDSYVLKVIDAAADAASVDCQAAVLRHLGRWLPALPVPRLFPTRSGAAVGRTVAGGAAHFTLLIAHLPGVPLAAMPSSGQNERLLQELGATLAHLDQALQGFSHSALAQHLAWDVRRLPELIVHADLLADAAVRGRILGVAASFAARLPELAALRSQAVHGDCHAGNVLVDEAAGRVSGVLDFGDMIHGPLLIEPAIAMSELLTEGIGPAAALEAVLRGYATVQKLQTAEVEALYDVIAARHAVTVLVHAWRRRHDPAGAGVLDAAAARAGQWLESQRADSRDALTRAWHGAAGTLPSAAPLTKRRRRLLGAGSELFYDEPLHLVRGSGVWLFDPAGRRYLDVYNNVPHVGHAHPAVLEAISRQAALLNTHTRYLHATVLDYAEQLVTRLPPHLDTCIFVNSGSEANDVAWRMAKFATGHDGGLVMEHAYHGITDAVAALTPITGASHDPRVETLRAPPACLSRTHEPDAGQLAAAGADTERALAALAGRGLAPAAFYLDSALTSNGIFDPPPAWASEIATRVRRAGGLIVGDEVQYGLGRSGSHFWGFERRGLAPDIVTMGKPVGNGFPLGVVVAGRALVEAFQKRFGLFSTFGGNPVAAAAGLAVLHVLDREGLMANAHATGAYLCDRLTEIAGRHACLGQVRGAGLLLGLEVLAADGEPSRVRARHMVNVLVREHGVLTGTEGPAGAVLKLRPPLVFYAEHADLLAAAIDATAAAIDASPL